MCAESSQLMLGKLFKNHTTPSVLEKKHLNDCMTNPRENLDEVFRRIHVTSTLSWMRREEMGLYFRQFLCGHLDKLLVGGGQA